MITIFEIEQAIEKATAATYRFSGTKNQFIEEIIFPLHDVLKTGICAGLKCDPESIRHKMESLENAIKCNLKFR